MDTNKQLKEIHVALSDLARRIERLERRIPEQESQQITPDAPATASTPPPPTPPPPPPVTEPSQKKEFLLGGNVFAILGVISLVIGVVAFYFYAITQGWINEIIRVIIVIAAGAVLIGIGEYLKHQYRRYASIITGGGIVLFYISVYMANVGYGILGDMFAYTALLLVTVLGGLIAMHRKDRSALVLAVVGGYLTPFIIGLTEGNPVIPVATYLTILNLLVVLGAFLRYSWRGITLAGLLASTVYGMVLTGWYDETGVSVFVVAILANWAIFLVASALVFFKRNSAVTWTDFSLVGLTGILMLAFFSPILTSHVPNIAGIVVAILSIAYLALAIVSGITQPEKERVRLAYAALFGLFLVVAVPLQFDANILPTAWGALALGFSLAALKLNWYRLQVVSFSSLALALLSYAPIMVGEAYPRMFVNQPTLTGLFLAAVAGVQWWCARNLERKRNMDAVASNILLILAHLTAIFTFLLEFNSAYEATLILGLGACILVTSGALLRMQPVRIAGLVVWGISIFALMGAIDERAINLTTSGSELVFLNIAFLLGALLAGTTIAQYLLIRSRTGDEAQGERGILLVGANVIALLALSTELFYAFAISIESLHARTPSLDTARIEETIRSIKNIRGIAFNMLWVLYGAALLAAGFLQRNRYARIGGILLIGIIIAKMYLLDIWSFDILYRFIAFTLLGIFLIVVAFGYNKYKDRIKEML